MGIHLRELSESFPMNTNMTGFRRFSKVFALLVIWTKVASALEGLMYKTAAMMKNNGCHQYELITHYNQVCPVDRATS